MSVRLLSLATLLLFTSALCVHAQEINSADGTAAAAGADEAADDVKIKTLEEKLEHLKSQM